MLEEQTRLEDAQKAVEARQKAIGDAMSGVKSQFEGKRALDEAGDIDGLYLYVARRRGMRPQGAMYKHIEEKNWPLFNLCGPEREAGMFNPIKGP